MKEKKEFENYIIMTLMIMLILLGTLQILFRFLLNFSLSWTEELTRYFFVLMVYTGASLALKQRKHVKVDILENMLSKTGRKYLYAINDCILIILLIWIGFAGLKICYSTWEMEQLSPAMELPMYLVYTIIPVTFFLGAFRGVQVFIENLKNKERG